MFAVISPALMTGAFADRMLFGKCPFPVGVGFEGFWFYVKALGSRL
jgi:ammonia channel protein AmtB